MHTRLGRWLKIAGLTAAIAVLAAACGAAEEPTATPTSAPALLATPTPTKVAAPPTPTTPPIERGGILKQSHRRSPLTFRMDVNSATDQIAAATPLFNQLIALQPPDFLTIGPDLAASWQVSADGKTYTFKIVPGIVDHKGNPWTAKDAKFTLDLLVKKTDSRPPHEYVAPGGVSVFESVEAPDDTTLIVKLKNVDSILFSQMALPQISMFTQASYDEKDSAMNPVGTGPYKLVKNQPGELVDYTANPNYFKKGLPYIDGLQTYIIADTATMHAAFEAKRIDLIMMGGSEGATERNTGVIERRHPGEITRYVGLHPVGRGITFNFRRDGPWRDVRVRQAINLALSRDDICSVIPNCYVGDWMPSPKWGISDRDKLAARPGFAKKGPAKDDEINKALDLLAQAGFAKGFTATALCRDNVDYRDYLCPLAEYVLRDTLNIRLTLDVRETGSWDEKRKTGDWDMEIGSTGGMRVDHPFNWLEIYAFCDEPPSRNTVGYCNPEYDNLLLRLRATTDEAQMRRISDQIMDILYTEMPAAMLNWSNRWVMHWNYVKNVPDQRFWGGYTQSRRLEQVWLDM